MSAPPTASQSSFATPEWEPPPTTRFTGIVRASDGSRISYGTAAVRAVVCLVLAGLSVALVGIALFALPMVTDQRRRGIHDRMAGTLVIRPELLSGWRVVIALALALAIVGVVLWFILGGGGSAN